MSDDNVFDTLLLEIVDIFIPPIFIVSIVILIKRSKTLANHKCHIMDYKQ